MKLLVEFELDESLEAYIQDNKEKLIDIIRLNLDVVKARIIICCCCSNRLAKPISETDYECVNCGKEIINPNN